MDVFLPVRFRTHVQLSPNGITTGTMDEHILQKIQYNLEGVCSRFGYIRPGSIEIVRRSMGSLMKAHFNGHIRYDVVCKADVCNPVRGMVFKAVVRKKNELGVLAEGGIPIDGVQMPVLDVLIPRRSAGIISDIDLETVDVGDEIFVEILGKRYQLHDKKISIIARAVKEPSKRRVREASSARLEEEGEDTDDVSDDGTISEGGSSRGGEGDSDCEDDGDDEEEDDEDECEGEDLDDLDQSGGEDESDGGGIPVLDTEDF